VPQDPFSSLDPRRNVRELVCEPLHVARIGPRRQRAARAVQALEAVGLSSILLERYPNEFSGGQRQRIAIARALYRDPAVLVLDEATSALDTATEAEFMDAVFRLRGQKTIIVVAHRLSTLRRCDRICVLEGGALQEPRSYESLARAAEGGGA
jgi:ABC-type dipeptide/oligopeptide/nickel transport system ATPase subunit